jgi:hypothetical protein
LGPVPNASSILVSISGVNFLLTEIALIVSSSCYTFVHPVIAVETSGLLMTQAIANWPIEQFSYLAMPANLFNASKVFDLAYSLNNLSNRDFSSGFLSNLLPSGIPLLYFPVRIPPANGENTVVPSLPSLNRWRNPNYILFRWYKLYSGCYTTGFENPYFSHIRRAWTMSSALHSLVPQ